MLSYCCFTGNKRSRLAATLASQVDRDGMQPHLRVWAGDQVYLDAPWYEFKIKTHSISAAGATPLRLLCASVVLRPRLGSSAAAGRECLLHRRSRHLEDNAPDPNVVARDTRKRKTREAWFDLARAARRRVSGDTGTAQRFSVSPLDFLVLNARVNRAKECATLFTRAVGAAA